MSIPDISPLVKGVLAVVALSIALGQNPKLEHWARAQAIQAMEWKEGLPYFFSASSATTMANHGHVKHHKAQEGGRQ